MNAKFVRVHILPPPPATSAFNHSATSLVVRLSVHLAVSLVCAPEVPPLVAFVPCVTHTPHWPLYKFTT